MFNKFMSLLMLCLGLYLLHWGLDIKERSSSTNNWTAIHAVVQESQISKSQGTTSAGPSYSAQVKYSYSVQGKSYTSSQVAYHAAASFHTEELARGFLSAYPKGATVTCYYNPSQHAEAVLTQGSTAEGPVLMALAAFALLISVVSFLKGGKGD